MSAAGPDFRPPGADRTALITALGSVLPGGRIIRPLGTSIETGPGPHALSVSRNGTVATADTGPERFGITVIDPPGKYGWRERHIWARTPHSTAPEIADPDWKGVAAGIAFDESGKSIWISEGASGRIRQIDSNTGDTRKTISLNTAEWKDSITADLTFDHARRLLFVNDAGNSRIAIIDAKTGRVVSSASIGDKPSALSLVQENTLLGVATADAVCEIDIHDAAKPGPPDCVQARSPNGIAGTANRMFISNAETDSITVLDTDKRAIVAEIPLSIPSLEKYRGIEPAGMAYDPLTKWLLVAESGINAVGVIDTGKDVLIGHLPAGWMPVRVAISGDRVYVVNALGRGTGPRVRQVLLNLGEVPSLYHGSVTTFIMPDASELLHHTGAVFASNGFIPLMHDPPRPPDAIKHVVLIEKTGRTFDEVLGDITSAGNGRVLSAPKIARFGMHGYADGGRTRFSIQEAAITPNQHAIAQNWAFSDNFYLSENSAEGEWRSRFQSSRASFRQIDDTASGVIDALTRMKDLPQFTRIRLSADKSAAYAYEASAVEESDLAVGRIVEYLSRSRWWPEMTIFVRDRSTQEGLDHVDSHRTVLLAAGPYVKQNYVSHVNSSDPSLLRTILELLHLPPAGLADATASSLQDMFKATPDLAPFSAIVPDRRIFEAAAEK